MRRGRAKFKNAGKAPETPPVPAPGLSGRALATRMTEAQAGLDYLAARLRALNDNLRQLDSQLRLLHLKLLMLRFNLKTPNAKRAAFHSPASSAWLDEGGFRPAGPRGPGGAAFPR